MHRARQGRREEEESLLDQARGTAVIRNCTAVMIVRGDGPLLARARFELVDTEAFLCSDFQVFELILETERKFFVARADLGGEQCPVRAYWK
jgi:hypothetical protein